MTTPSTDPGFQAWRDRKLYLETLDQGLNYYNAICAAREIDVIAADILNPPRPARATIRNCP